MPTRLVREGLLSSDAVARAGELAEVLFVRLMLVADDFGRFDGRVTVICRACWPIGLTTDPNPQEVASRLALLVKEKLVLRYEIDGKPFIYIPKFKQRTRANRSKFPEPPSHDGHMTGICQASAGHMTDKARADDGQVTGTCRPTSEAEAEAYSEAEAVSDSVSDSERARTQIETVDKNTAPVDKNPDPHRLPGELPSEFLHRLTGQRKRPPTAFEETP